MHLVSFLLCHWPHLVDSASIAVYIVVLERVTTSSYVLGGAVPVFLKKEDKEEAEEWRGKRRRKQSFFYLAQLIGQAGPLPATLPVGELLDQIR